jgi:hypothetical protein
MRDGKDPWGVGTSGFFCIEHGSGLVPVFTNRFYRMRKNTHVPVNGDATSWGRSGETFLFFWGVVRAPNLRSRLELPDASWCCPVSSKRNLRFGDVR